APDSPPQIAACLTTTPSVVSQRRRARPCCFYSSRKGHKAVRRSLGWLGFLQDLLQLGDLVEIVLAILLRLVAQAHPDIPAQYDDYLRNPDVLLSRDSDLARFREPNVEVDLLVHAVETDVLPIWHRAFVGMVRMVATCEQGKPCIGDLLAGLVRNPNRSRDHATNLGQPNRLVLLSQCADIRRQEKQKGSEETHGHTSFGEHCFD